MLISSLLWVQTDSSITLPIEIELQVHEYNFTTRANLKKRLLLYLQQTHRHFLNSSRSTAKASVNQRSEIFQTQVNKLILSSVNSSLAWKRTSKLSQPLCVAVLSLVPFERERERKRPKLDHSEHQK